MSRTLHDSFAKEWMQEFLADFGTVQTEYEISSEVRHADVYFEPDPAKLPAPMGAFGRMITEPCLIEPFRNAIPIAQIANCKAKSTILGLNLVRQAKQETRKFSFEQRPFLWMISPTLSQSIREGFGAVEDSNWDRGIYFLPRHDRAAIIAIHQLPVTPDTLWLRLLGRGNVQKKAFDELITLPTQHPYRTSTLRHVGVLQRNLSSRQNVTRDLEEVIMTLSITYAQFEAEIEAKIEAGRDAGRDAGRKQTQREIALRMLQEGIDRELPVIE
jgi:hypothetical protein